MLPIKLTQASTTKVTGATVAANSLLAGLPTSGRVQIRLYNDGSVTAFVRFGTAAAADAAKVTTDVPLPAGAIEVQTIDVATATYMSVITASGTADIYATPGDGV